MYKVTNKIYDKVLVKLENDKVHIAFSTEIRFGCGIKKSPKKLFSKK